MKYFHQKNWVSIHVTGGDRIAFLQNLLSQDIHALAEEDSGWACLLDNKSKLIAFLGVGMKKEYITLFMHRKLQDQVMQTLEMYTIIQDVALLKQSSPVYFTIGDKTVLCSSEPGTQEINSEQFEKERIMFALPLYEIDYQNPIPLEVPFMRQAISFTKGCYVGQETIARLYSRGMNVNKKLVQISSNKAFQKGDLLYHLQEEVGEITSATQIKENWIGLGWLKRKAFGKDIKIDDQTIHVTEEIV